MKYYTRDCAHNMVHIFSIFPNNILSAKGLNIAIQNTETIVRSTLNTVYYYIFVRVCMCNGYDLLDDMEVGEMFDVLMDNVTMEQDFIKNLYSFEDVHNLQIYEWNIIQTFSYKRTKRNGIDSTVERNI